MPSAPALLWLAAPLLSVGLTSRTDDDAMSPALPPLAPAALPGTTLDDGCEPPEPGFLTLDTAPWTVVYVDGDYVGSTPLYRHKLAPGAHRLTLVNEGRGIAVSEDVVIEQAHARKLRLVLLVEETAPAIDDTRGVRLDADDCFIPEDEAATLTVDTQPWSKVILDGRVVGSTPLFKHAIAAGPHVVRLVRADGKAAFARFTAVAGETVKLSFALAE